MNANGGKVVNLGSAVEALGLAAGDVASMLAKGSPYDRPAPTPAAICGSIVCSRIV